MGKKLIVSLLAVLMLSTTIAGVARAQAPAPKNTIVQAEPVGGDSRQAPGTLFVIERSKNANVVAYEVRQGPAGFDVKEPVRARWLMLDTDGHVEDLTKLEKKVYGVKVKHASYTEVSFAISALPDREITVRPSESGPEAIVDIGGVPARLESVYVSSSEGLVPKVKWVEMKGRSLADGSIVTERITR
ncbi:MAG TPA: DUF4833 domain-containing protein [Vulgatibacter sp.]